MGAVRLAAAVVLASLLCNVRAHAAESPASSSGTDQDVAKEIRARYAADPATLGLPDGNAVVVVPAAASREVPFGDGSVAQPMPQPRGCATVTAPVPSDPCCLRCPRWSVAIGAWIWGIEGRLGDNGRIVTADSDWTDTLDHLDQLEFAIDARVRTEWSRWTATVQVDGATLEDSATFRDGALDVQASVAFWTLQGDVGYKVLGGPLGCDPCPPALCVELYAGARAYWADLDVDATVGALNRLGSSMSWVDPLVGFRAHMDVRKWRFGLEGDIGGFGAGSDLAWSVNGFAGLRFSRTFGLVVGWRILDVDYESGAEIFDARLSGPFTALTITL